MKPLPPHLIALMAIGASMVLGCATPKKPDVHSVSVAVTTSDGKPPSQDQVARILAALWPEIERAGFKLARAPNEADFVVSVRYTADAEGTGGRVSISGMEPTARFKSTPGMGESEELREIRRRIREMDAWSARQMTRTDL